ncbi:MAG: MFS transporter [Bacteroidales bacterium]|nr:MFS transporter [Bacteroidales bacterium]
MEHNIKRLYIIKIAKWFMLTMPILMIFYGEMGFSAQESFLLKSCYSLSIVIFEVPSGYAADVWGRKRTLVTGSILGTVGFVIYSLFSGFYAFMAAELILGLGMSFISGADSAMIYDTLLAQKREREYAKYEGRNFSVGNFSEAIAGAIGGGLATINIHYPFYAQTFIAFLAVPAALTLVEPPMGKSCSQKHTNIVEMLRYALVTNRALRWNIIYSSVLGCATLSMAWVYPLRLSGLGYNEFEIGSIHTVLNLILGTVTLFSYKIEQRLRPRATVWLSTLTLTTAFVLAGLASDYWLLAVLTVFYFCRGIATPVLKDYVNRMTSSDIRATVLSLRSLIIRGMFVLVGPFFGTMTDTYGIENAFIILGLAFIVITMAGISLFLKAIKE